MGHLSPLAFDGPCLAVLLREGLGAGWEKGWDVQLALLLALEKKKLQKQPHHISRKKSRERDIVGPGKAEQFCYHLAVHLLAPSVTSCKVQQRLLIC